MPAHGRRITRQQQRLKRVKIRGRNERRFQIAGDGYRGNRCPRATMVLATTRRRHGNFVGRGLGTRDLRDFVAATATVGGWRRFYFAVTRGLGSG